MALSVTVGYGGGVAKPEMLTGPQLSDPSALGATLGDLLIDPALPRRVRFFTEEEIPMTRYGTLVNHDWLLALVHDRVAR